MVEMSKQIRKEIGYYTWGLRTSFGQVVPGGTRENMPLVASLSLMH